jgi:hypothetical protein
MKENRKKRRSKLFNLDPDIIILSESDMFTDSKPTYPSEKKTLKNVSSNLKDEVGVSGSSKAEEGDRYTTTEDYTVGCAEECYRCEMSQLSWFGNFIPSKFCEGMVRSCLFPRNFSIWYPGIKL